MGRDGFTVPTRSRAIARTSFFWSNPFGLKPFRLDLGGVRFMVHSGCKEAI
jgi:hypothetical protein